MNKVISNYRINDMVLRYVQGVDSKGNESVGMELIPLDMLDQIVEIRNHAPDPLIQVKLVGDDYPSNYDHGRTMKNSQSTFLMKYIRQEHKEFQGENQIITYFEDQRKINYEHYICYRNTSKAIYCYVKIINHTPNSIGLEMLSSFTLGGISPMIEGVAANKLLMHQIKSTWSYEGRLVTHPIEEYMLEPSWKPSGTNSIRFGQIGSMPNREYFPFVAIEDSLHNVFWGVQLAIASSWQLEVYRKDDGLNLSGGIVDREKGQWKKWLKAGESFITPKAIISTGNDDIDDLCQRITSEFRNDLEIKEFERDMPIIFNEFCTTWGNPSGQEIKKIVDVIANQGIEYFVIDCGWYKKSVEHNDSWNIQHGDWEYNHELFDQGIKAIVNYLHDKGMKAGIWFEFETCGRKSDLFDCEDLLYQRDGYPLTVGNRRFLNLLDQRVIDYLDKQVLGFLVKNEFDYLKIDYNDNLGIGIDGGDSFGDQLYQSGLKTLEYIKKIKSVLPNLVIENCSAGGHRLVEPFMKITDMSSFSDAHESLCIPIIGANLQRMILPRQSQIWAVLHSEYDLKMIYYKISSTFFGRICLSGNVTALNPWQWQVIREGIDFYHQVSSIIDLGNSKIKYHGSLSYEEPSGYQIVIRTYLQEVLVLIHTFAKAPQQLIVELPNYQIISYYGGNEVMMKDDCLVISKLEEFNGSAIYLRKKNGS